MRKPVPEKCVPTLKMTVCKFKSNKVGEEQDTLLKLGNKGCCSKRERVGSSNHCKYYRVGLGFVFKSILRWHCSKTEGLGMLSK